MKNFVILFLTLLIITNAKSQTECTVKIMVTVNKSNPPSYTFKTEPQVEGSKYYWAFSDKMVSEQVSPTREFKTSGNYVTEVKVTKPDGSNCYGRLEARFEGTVVNSGVLYGKGKVVDKSAVLGCSLVIIPENGIALVPAELPQGVTLKLGQYVEYAYELIPDKKSECGIVVKILKIAEIAINNCNVPIHFAKVPNSPGTYQFKTAEQPAGAKYYWYFGELGVSNIPSPVFTFNITGTYKITLKVVDAAGKVCTNGISGFFEGKTSPVLTAKGKVKKLDAVGCGLVIVIENGTVLIPVKMATDFQLREGQYVEFVYEKLVEKISTCREGTDIKVHRIMEIPIGSACKAFFTVAPAPVTLTATSKKVVFTNQSSGEIKECYWNFGDNTTGTSIEKTVVHEYANPGEYKVCLVIKTNSECKSDFCTVIKIPGTTTDCKFDIISKPKEANPKTFLFSTVSPVEIKTWKWSFGDGISSDAKFPEHKYEKTGVYEVGCTVVTASGCSATRTIKVIVADAPLPACKGPVSLVLFDAVDNKCNGKAIVKLLNENGAELENVKYAWSNGMSGSVVEALCPDKAYVVQATIAGVCQKVTSFTMLSKPLWRVTTVNGINNFKVVEPKEGIVYEWNFGSGLILKGAEINYEFEKEGVYDVKLTASSGSDFSEYSQEVIVLKSITGTTVLNKNDIRIFPNPAKHVLNVGFGNEVRKEMVAEISSIAGQKVLSQRLHLAGLNQTTINIQSLKEGIYFLRILDGNQIISMQKFIKGD